MKVDERVITITDRIYFSHFVDKLDEKLAQYDIRGDLAKQAAEALSTKIDKEVFVNVAKAVVTAGVADQAAGTSVTIPVGDYHTQTDVELRGDAVVNALFDINAEFNSKDVPMDGRIFVTTPTVYSEIVRSQKAVNRDFTNGNGGIDTGTVLNIAGTPIIWSNHLPIGDATYDPNSQLLGLFFQPECVGVVKAMDVQSEANYLPEKLGWLLTSYYALGMDVLRPASAGQIIKALA